MSKLVFFDKDIKKKYLSLLNNAIYLDLIINQLLNEYDDVTIKDVLFNNNDYKIIINTFEDDIILSSNDNSEYVYLSSVNWEHVTIYSKLIKKYYVPIGKEYHKENRVVLKYYQDMINPHKFSFKNDGNNYFEYEIDIKKKDDDIDDLLIIKTLLNKDNNITRIKDLLELMSKIININDVDIKIQCKSDKGSMLLISNGTIVKYVEYFKEDDRQIKIYLDNEMFYQDITKSSVIEDDIIPFVKKKGGRNG